MGMKVHAITNKSSEGCIVDLVCDTHPEADSPAARKFAETAVIEQGFTRCGVNQEGSVWAVEKDDHDKQVDHQQLIKEAQAGKPRKPEDFNYRVKFKVTVGI